MLPLATALLLAVGHHHGVQRRIIGIVFIVIGAFTFTFRRALAARSSVLAPRYSRTVGPLMSGAFVVIGLVLLAI